MDTRRGLVGLLFGAAWLAACLGLASAVALPVSDGFENITIGDYPDENGWHTWYSGVTAYVSNLDCNGGTRSFRLTSYPFWSRCDYLDLDEVPNWLTYQASLRADPIPGRAAWVGLAGSVAGQLPCYNHFIVNSEDGVLGSVEFSGAASQPPIVIGLFPVADWVTVRADLDFVAQTADLWVDGVVVAVGVPIQPKEFDDPAWGHVVLDRFGAAEYNWIGGGIGVIYVDDVDLISADPPLVLAAEVAIRPSNLNSRSKGPWVLCSVELPEGYDPADIDVASLSLEEAVPAAPVPAMIGDYDGDGVPDLTVRFDRGAVTDLLAPGTSEVTLSGALVDGTPLAGSDVLRLIH